MNPMPKTLHGQPALLVLSALQKHIRRSNHEGAMSCAVELILTNKAYCTMVCNRLQLICHEDLDMVARPDVFPFVRAACEYAKESWNTERPGKTIMPVGNAIRLMCAAPKSRIGCHFAIVFQQRAQQSKTHIADIPDYALDMHTHSGRKQGRGLRHFREEGAKLVDVAQDGSGYTEVVTEDQYATEAYERLAIAHSRKIGGDIEDED